MAEAPKPTSGFNARSVVRKILWILPVSVAVSVIIAILLTDTSELLTLRRFAAGYFILAAGLRLVPWITKTLRLMNWMDFLGHPFSFRKGLQITVMSELGAAVSPTLVGGEPVKATMLYGHGVSLGEATSLTSIAAVEDLTFYLVGMPVAFVLASAFRIARVGELVTDQFVEGWWVYAVAGTVVLAIVAAALVIRRTKALPRFRVRVRRFWHEFKRLYREMIRRGKNRFLVNLLLAAIHWIARYSVVSALALSLGYEVNVFAVVVVQWLVFAAMAFIPTPGATGGAEGIFLLVFATILPGETIGTILIGWRFLDYYLVAILALIVLGIQSLIARLRSGSATRVGSER
ncbi:MAG: lysylphosphatidylglycerol synthase transmembrane domain-containing protein [Spirochaetota bacterium]